MSVKGRVVVIDDEVNAAAAALRHGGCQRERQPRGNRPGRARTANHPGSVRHESHGSHASIFSAARTG